MEHPPCHPLWGAEAPLSPSGTLWVDDLVNWVASTCTHEFEIWQCFFHVLSLATALHMTKSFIHSCILQSYQTDENGVIFGVFFCFYIL